MPTKKQKEECPELLRVEAQLDFLKKETKWLVNATHNHHVEIMELESQFEELKKVCWALFAMILIELVVFLFITFFR